MTRLGETEKRVLKTLRRANEPRTLESLSDSLCVDKYKVSDAIATLIKEGYVARTGDLTTQTYVIYNED